MTQRQRALKKICKLIKYEKGWRTSRFLNIKDIFTSRRNNEIGVISELDTEKVILVVFNGKKFSYEEFMNVVV